MGIWNYLTSDYVWDIVAREGIFLPGTRIRAWSWSSSPTHRFPTCFILNMINHYSILYIICTLLYVYDIYIYTHTFPPVPYPLFVQKFFCIHHCSPFTLHGAFCPQICAASSSGPAVARPSTWAAWPRAAWWTSRARWPLMLGDVDGKYGDFMGIFEIWILGYSKD